MIERLTDKQMKETQHCKWQSERDKDQQMQEICKWQMLQWDETENGKKKQFKKFQKYISGRSKT